MSDLSSALIDDELKEQLRGVLERLERDVTVVTVCDNAEPKCAEMRDFLEVIASLSPHVHVRVLQKGEEPKIEAEIEAERLPVAALYNEAGQFARVRFHGVPGGQEINSFVLALYNLAGPGQPLERKLIDDIDDISEKVDIKICVSLACHHCPGTVVACQRIAILNPNVRAAMLDANLYPDLLEQFHIERVPALILNNSKVLVGTKTIQQLCDLLD